MTRLALALALFGPLVGGARDPIPQAPAAPLEAAAQAQLQRAAQLRGLMRGTRGKQREALRARVVEAYRLVGEQFGEQETLVAEACFRAGEVLRAGGDRAGARAEFQLAREHGSGTDWSTRAGLELGHLARRAQLFEEALRHYRAVFSDPQSAPARRDDALLWGGRCCTELGRAVEARELLQRVADRAEDPCDRVAAHDELALGWVTAGDLEAAAGQLDRCRVALRDTAVEQTPLGGRVRSALVRMRAVERLRRAIAARRDGVVVER